MSVQAMAWVIENSQTRGNQYIVLLMIANRADEDGASAWPSIRWLAKRSRLSERTVQRALKNLERGGALGISRGAGPRGTNQYQVIMQNCFSTTGDMRDRGDKLTPRQIVHKGVTGVSPDTSYTSKYKTPLPPTGAGGSDVESFMDYQGTVIAVKMGNRRRLPKHNGGAMFVNYYVDFLRSRGFPARIVERVELQKSN